jgi:hypothetical protein
LSNGRHAFRLGAFRPRKVLSRRTSPFRRLTGGPRFYDSGFQAARARAAVVLDTGPDRLRMWPESHQDRSRRLDSTRLGLFHPTATSCRPIWASNFSEQHPVGPLPSHGNGSQSPQDVSLRYPNERYLNWRFECGNQLARNHDIQDGGRGAVQIHQNVAGVSVHAPLVHRFQFSYAARAS